jgi:hypothetical protein
MLVDVRLWLMRESIIFRQWAKTIQRRHSDKVKGKHGKARKFNELQANLSIILQYFMRSMT